MHLDMYSRQSLQRFQEGDFGSGGEFATSAYNELLLFRTGSINDMTLSCACEISMHRVSLLFPKCELYYQCTLWRTLGRQSGIICISPCKDLWESVSYGYVPIYETGRIYRHACL